MLPSKLPATWLFMLVLLCLTAINSKTVYANTQNCYKIPQFEAEQGLRIHSELLVISLTCQKTPGHGKLYSKYQRFTKKNKLLLAEYENTLIQFFKNSGSPSPAKDLHTLRTNLANDISQHAVNMSVTSFCNYFVNRIDRALNMNKKTLKRWARQIWPDQKTSHELCPADKSILLQEMKNKKKRIQLLIDRQRELKSRK